MNRAGASPARRRGQPIVALLAVICLWIALRMLFWQPPLALSATSSGNGVDRPAGLFGAAQPPAAQTPAPPTASNPGAARRAQPVLPRALVPPPADWLPAPIEPLVEPLGERPLMQAEDGYSPHAALDDAAPDSRPVSARRIIGHTMLLAAGLAHMPLPPALEQYLRDRGPRENPATPAAPGRTFAAAGAVAEYAGDAAARPAHWSADGWVLLRGDASPVSAAVRPSYGRSQAGAVVRHALAPGDPRAPQAYLRASTALEGPREHEAALGLSARPFAALPVRVAAEARLADTAQGTEPRAAVFAISEFPPLALPGGVTGEAYVQAGYVTGAFETAFVDGLARASRTVASLRDFRLSAGGGVWGGAQEGAERLDAGPSASVTFPVGEGFGRLSADYRFRVAGEAEPASGPALTLSAGF